MQDREAVAPGPAAHFVANAYVAAYVVLLVMYLLFAPSSRDDSAETLRDYSHWSIQGMAGLMFVAGLYTAYMAITSLLQRRFPADGVPVLAATAIRRARAAILPSVFCLLISLPLLMLPLVYFVALSRLD